MDIGKSFSFVFDDPRWVTKVLIGGLIAIFSFLIIPAFIVVGYTVQLIRNVIAGEQHPMPEWDRIGDYLVDGLKVFVVFLVFAIPGIVLSMLGGIGRIGWLFSLLGTLYLLAVQLVAPAVLKSYLDAGNDIGAGFRFQEIFAMVQVNLGDFIIVWLLALVAGIIGGLGFIVCCIGALFTLPYSFMVRGHLYGQLIARLGGAVAVTEPPLLPETTGDTTEPDATDR
ncbi:MAG: DUF4013 domain-containing protein [Chloroflexi bacterium]|nr:DUF4013 domain-containing protein [Chloroflexota bacterium]